MKECLHSTACPKFSNNVAQPLQCISYHKHTLALIFTLYKGTNSVNVK